VFDYPETGEPCLLIRRSQDEFVAFSQKCTHLSCAVIYAKDNDRIECPCHNGYFSARDGRVLQGPPPRPLPRVLLERRGGELVAVGMTTGSEG
jgi:Rieske Fe-S protein